MQKYLWLFLPIVAWAAACKGPEKVAYTPDQIVPTERSVFWKISGNGLKKSSYLYGTIHLIPKSDYQMPEAARTALEHTDRVAFEIDMKEMTNIFSQLGLVTKAFMKGGKQLKDLLSPEDYTFVKGKIKEKGLPGGMLERIKPMFLMMMFADGGNNTAEEGKKLTSVEMELYEAARKRRIESAGLETAAYQMSIFDSIPYEVQAKMLVKTLRTETAADAEAPSELDKMLALYRDQNIQEMQQMVGAEDSDIGDYQDILLNQRNRNWIPVMGRMMRDRPTMFAVGAGHLGGPEGVIALLRKAGYRVEVAH